MGLLEVEGGLGGFRSAVALRVDGAKAGSGRRILGVRKGHRQMPLPKRCANARARSALMAPVATIIV